MAVYIPTRTPPSFAASFANLGQLSVGPALELQFNIAQNTLLGRLNKDIATLQSGGTSTEGETAHLRRRITSAGAKIAELEPYATRTAANESLVKSTLDRLSELTALADPSTSADFDAKLQETLDILDKIQTAGNTPAGMVNDGLRTLRASTVAGLQAIVTNGFATPADVTSVTDAVNTLALALTDGLVMVELASDTATNAVTSFKRIKSEAEAKVLEIELAAKDALTKKIEDARDYYGRILSSLSYSLDAAVNLTGVLNESFNHDLKPQTGTMLDYLA